MKKSRIGSKIYIALCMIFLYAPILVLIVFSFNESKSRAYFTGFTFKWYRQLLENDLIMTSLFNSLLIALLASVISAVVGTAAAVGISKFGKRARGVIMNVTYLPVLNPEIVTGISMMLLFVFFKNLFGFKMGFATVLIAHITFCLSFVVITVGARLDGLKQEYEEAAGDLYARPWQCFRYITLPLIMPGITARSLSAE